MPPASSSPWKRCSELREAGLIQDTGQRRDSTYGSEVMVCRITSKGSEAYEKAMKKAEANG